jgi:phage terminase large subunit-like protein
VSARTEALPRFACPDWWDKILAGQTPMADVPVNEERAAKARAFFDRLRLPDVVGQPTMAEACGEWFRDILVAFLASEDPETLQPQVWELLCMVPKKNSKTTYTAGLALTALYMEEAPNRQMLVVGPSQNISERCFDQAQGMIRIDPVLSDVFGVQDHLKTITRRKTGTKLEVKTFDTSIVTGEIPAWTFIDELHELGKKAKAASVMQQIRGGGITKTRGRLMMITTQSDESPAGVWRTELDKARAIREGKGGSSPIMLPVLYEFPAELQRNETYWRNQRHWSAVLPNLGLSIDRQALVDDWENNGKVNKLTEQIWASQHLNIEIGVGLSAGWVGAHHWEAASFAEIADLGALMARSEVVVVGIDGGGLDDLLGIAVIGREKDTRRWLLWAHAWAHPEVFEQRKEIAPRLLQFAEDGDLTILTDDDPTGDLIGVADVVERLMLAGLLPDDHAIGVDQAGIGAILDELVGRGVSDDQVIGIRQGWSLNPAIKGMPRKLKDGTLVHGGREMMDWVIGNAKPIARGNAVMIDKETAGKAKIDPLVAAFNAYMLMQRNPEPASGAFEYTGM